MIRPIRQDQDYHRFADGRALLGMENAADVLSNIPFIVVGAMGLVFMALLAAMALWIVLRGVQKRAALTDRFTAQCGYHPGREQRLAQMLVFQDVNK